MLTSPLFLREREQLELELEIGASPLLKFLIKLTIIAQTQLFPQLFCDLQSRDAANEAWNKQDGRRTAEGRGGGSGGA